MKTYNQFFTLAHAPSTHTLPTHRPARLRPVSRSVPATHDDPITRLRLFAASQPDLDWRSGDGWIHVCKLGDDNAPVISLLAERELNRFILVIGAWNDTFTSADAAFNLARKALTGDLRVKIERRRGRDRAWTVEVITTDNAWVPLAEMSTVEFWRSAKTEVR